MEGASPAGPRWLSVPSATTLNVRSPTFVDGKSAREWGKIIEMLEEGDLDAALGRLVGWERRYGRQPASEELRDQLHRLGVAHQDD